jgi:hypothetical protein
VFRWRITLSERYTDSDSHVTQNIRYEIAGDTLHITPNGDLCICGPVPKVTTLFARASGQWVMVEKIGDEPTR